MNTKDVLIAARKKIERPENWTQFVSARAADGSPAYTAEVVATCWCALGAVWAVNPFAASDLYPHVPKEFSGVAEFNDHPATTHADVLALFDRAIAACEEE